jgi:hypothetical protein
MANPLFKTKVVHIQTLGDYLGQIRSQLNLDVKTVSLLTQIKLIYIEELELGNWEKLPGDVYIRGFLKSLANLYHIHEQVLIDQYDKEHGFGQVKKAIIKNNAFKFNFTPKTIIIAVTIVLSVTAVGYVISQISSVLTPPKLELSEPSGDATIQGNSIVFAGLVEIGADVFINGQPLLTDKDGQFTENLVLSPGLNVIQIVAKNKFNKESRITRQIKAEIAQNIPESVASAVKLILNIGPSSAWIYLEADGVVVQRGTMLPGSSKNVTAKDEILLTSANAGSTQVIYNGKDLGKLGRETEVIRNVEFSATNVNQ